MSGRVVLECGKVESWRAGLLDRDGGVVRCESCRGRRVWSTFALQAAHAGVFLLEGGNFCRCNFASGTRRCGGRSNERASEASVEGGTSRSGNKIVDKV